MRAPNRPRRRRPRRHTLRPGAERLEPRIAPSADIGINLDFNADYNLDPIWTDLHNLASPNGWVPVSGTTGVPVTADGYPLVDASVYMRVDNYPAGNYQFSYTGDATVSFSYAGQLVGPVTVANGITTGTVAIDPSVNGGFLTMTVTGVDPSDPMDNFHLMMPGYGNGTTAVPMYTPAFLRALQPFSTIRFMNWTMVNSNPVANWSDRVGPNAFITDGPGGVPYEDMIELCNEAHKDMWLNIPVNATPQFVQSLAQLVADRLDPTLNVYVEYGNEIWNFAFENSAVYAAAQANPILNQSLGRYQLVAQQSAYSLVNDGQIFDQVFGAAAARVRPVLGGQLAWTAFSSYGLQFIQQYFGPPSKYLYAIGAAPYVTIYDSQNVAGLTLDQLFADMHQYLNNSIVPWIHNTMALASQYGLRMVGYEGGQGLVPGANNLNFGLFQQAQSDPRMFQLYVELVNDWQQGGGQLLNAYQLTGGGSKWGFWGMLPTVLTTGSQKYDALLSTRYLPGDANTDGSVDWADFQIIQASYGAFGAHWVQGDANDDGAVNWADLNLMRQGLDPSGFTLSQFAQQAVFGQPSIVSSPTALEYDGYGVTYASDLPLAATSGTVRPDRNSQGQPILLGGASYIKGLGFAGGSSTSIALNGRYSSFASTIGVDSSGSTASSVIFQVYGDGQLLYQSPVMADGSSPVSIDIGVAGVQNLTLVMQAAPGSLAADDHGAWGDARLISTANFGSSQPYTLTWQVSQNGQILSTQTTDSFTFAPSSGTYTISVTASDAQGHTATASTTATLKPQTASVAFVRKDTTSEGNWVGMYGATGDDVIGKPAALPAYAAVAPSGQSNWTWAASTTDVRALQAPGGSGRIAACWYAGSSFKVDLNLTDGQAHDLELYFLDWDSSRRAETVTIKDAATGAVLDTRSIASFHNGVYLDYRVSGHVVITITRTGGANAVLSGLFLD